MIPSQLTKVVQSTTDQLGNTSDSTLERYTYDDAGRLVQKTKSWYGDYYAWVYDYVYESKPLAQRVETYLYRGEENYHITKVFTSDDQGRSLSAEVTSTNESDTYASRQLNYVYEDLYFFDSTGLVTEEN